jgi:hypothetical protein
MRFTAILHWPSIMSACTTELRIKRREPQDSAFDEKDLAESFGLEIARLLVDTCYRDVVIAKYESEKEYVKRSRLRH